MPELNEFLMLGAVLFSLSVAGIFLNRKNLIILLMCIELSATRFLRNLS